MAGFKRGAIVRLRSGGPEMTIERIFTLPRSTNRHASCQWFDKLRLRDGTFLLHSLVPKSAPEGEDCTDEEIAEHDAVATAELEAAIAAVAAAAELRYRAE
jgi:uncharacterized protein YodC (DUF2158 family)